MSYLKPSRLGVLAILSMYVFLTTAVCANETLQSNVSGDTNILKQGGTNTTAKSTGETDKKEKEASILAAIAGSPIQGIPVLNQGNTATNAANTATNAANTATNAANTATNAANTGSMP